jgi:hypothetical protein
MHSRGRIGRCREQGRTAPYAGTGEGSSGVAAIGASLWLLVLRVVRSRGRSAPILAVVVTTVTAALALFLLVSSEYGAQIFPPQESSRPCCSGAGADGR